MSNSVNISDVLSFCDQLLNPADFKDYVPNGLQIAGREQISKIVSAVTASQPVIDQAVSLGADLLLVHHGYFWKNEPPELTGMKKKRIKTLLEADINLVAYHLPLDFHPEVGNNAWLAELLGVEVEQRFGHANLAICGSMPESISVDELSKRLSQQLQRHPMAVGPMEKPLKRIGICSGAAEDMIAEAKSLGCDAFISGEISERTTHYAREEDIVYFSAGHHATERGGVRLLGDRLAAEFSLEHVFVDDNNPV